MNLAPLWYRLLQLHDRTWSDRSVPLRALRRCRDRLPVSHGFTRGWEHWPVTKPGENTPSTDNKPA